MVGIGPQQRVGQAHAVFSNLARVHWKDLREIFAGWQA